ncbi:hypothetical protein Ccrd_023750, partial [Cynara cardunculus var. scolymus]
YPDLIRLDIVVTVYIYTYKLGIWVSTSSSPICIFSPEIHQAQLIVFRCSISSYSRASNPFRFGRPSFIFTTQKEGNVFPFQIDVSDWSTATIRICNCLAVSSCCMYGSSGCLGCDAKHKLMKGQESQIRSASRPSMAEGVLTSSRLDVDNSAQWVGNKGKSNQGDQLRESRLSWNETYVSLLGSNKPFAMPVPLSVSFFDLLEFRIMI